MRRLFSNQYGPNIGEILGICDAMNGWVAIGGIGPKYFLSPEAERDLLRFIYGNLEDISYLENALCTGRAAVVNFFDLISGSEEFHPAPASQFLNETRRFLNELRQQVEIWRTEGITYLNLSDLKVDILARVSAKTKPVLHFMGFPRAIPHSSQVARMCGSIARNHLQATESQVLMAIVVGMKHDPKLEPRFDLDKINVAMHPTSAVSLGYITFQDPDINRLLLPCCGGDQIQTDDFIEGTLDVLGIGSDSWYVNMIVDYPVLCDRINNKCGEEAKSLNADLKEVMEARLWSASKGLKPPSLPPHLHGLLAQEFLDSGFRGISKTAWRQAISEANIATENPITLFHQLVGGNLGNVNQGQIEKLRKFLRSNPKAILKVMISATRLFHHHLEVVPGGLVAALALSTSDMSLLEPGKVAAVSDILFIKRIGSFDGSYAFNMKQLPRETAALGPPWHRAVELSMLLGRDILDNTEYVLQFEATHKATSVEQDIADLRKLVLAEETWGKWANVSGKMQENPMVRQAVEALESGYQTVVDQYRQAAYAGQSVSKFIPKRG